MFKNLMKMFKTETNEKSINSNRSVNGHDFFEIDPNETYTQDLHPNRLELVADGYREIFVEKESGAIRVLTLGDDNWEDFNGTWDDVFEKTGKLNGLSAWCIPVNY